MVFLMSIYVFRYHFSDYSCPAYRWNKWVARRVSWSLGITQLNKKMYLSMPEFSGIHVTLGRKKTILRKKSTYLPHQSGQETEDFYKSH